MGQWPTGASNKSRFRLGFPIYLKIVVSSGWVLFFVKKLGFQEATASQRVAPSESILTRMMSCFLREHCFGPILILSWVILRLDSSQNQHTTISRKNIAGHSQPPPTTLTVRRGTMELFLKEGMVFHLRVMLRSKTRKKRPF